MTFLELVQAVLDGMPRLLRTTAIITLLGVIVALLLPPSYDARVSFYPEAKSSGLGLPSSLASFASMYGIADLGSGAESPRFYANIATSDAVLDRILADSMASAAGPQSRTAVLALLKVRHSWPQREIVDGRKALRDMTKVTTDMQTNIVTITVTSRDPVFAWALANRFLREVNTFNVQRRNSRGKEARQFAETRQQWAREQLQAAEDSLRTFMNTNRLFESSPTLRLRSDGLQRQVSLAQNVYVSVSQQLEQSRVQEVNDLPVVTVVDTAMVPPRKARPKRAYVVLFFLVFGAFAASAQIVARAVIDKRLADGDEEFRKTIALFRNSLRLPWRRRAGPAA